MRLFLEKDEIQFILKNRALQADLASQIAHESSDVHIRHSGSIVIAKYYEAGRLLGLPLTRECYDFQRDKPRILEAFYNKEGPLNVIVTAPNTSTTGIEAAKALVEAHFDTGVFSGPIDDDDYSSASSCNMLLSLAEHTLSKIKEMSASLKAATKSELASSALAKEESAAASTTLKASLATGQRGVLRDKISFLICKLAEEIVKKQIFSDGNHRLAIHVFYDLHLEILHALPKLSPFEVHGSLTLARATGDRFTVSIEDSIASKVLGSLYSITRLRFFSKDAIGYDAAHRQLQAIRYNIADLENRLKKLALTHELLHPHNLIVESHDQMITVAMKFAKKREYCVSNIPPNDAQEEKIRQKKLVIFHFDSTKNTWFVHGENGVKIPKKQPECLTQYLDTSSSEPTKIVDPAHLMQVIDAAVQCDSITFKNIKVVPADQRCDAEKWQHARRGTGTDQVADIQESQSKREALATKAMNYPTLWESSPKKHRTKPIREMPTTTPIIQAK